jgi:SAM-dependent methyltransferase
VAGDGFEAVAEDWLGWARTPGFDAYWSYRDAFFELVPPPSGRTLEVGCGEGRVARDLAVRGHAVTGIDASPTLVAAATAADARGRYEVARAEALPFGDAEFGTVVAYNALMDVDDMPAAIAEAARVLAPGGALCVAVTHPMADAGRWEGAGEDAPFVVRGSYLAGGRFDAVEERGGRTMRFTGWMHPLEAYVGALAGAGLVVDALREPLPAGDDPQYARWRRVPCFLFLRARHAGTTR